MNKIDRDRETDAHILRVLRVVREHGLVTVRASDLARSVYREPVYTNERCRSLKRSGKVVIGVCPRNRTHNTVTLTDFGLRCAEKAGG